MVQGGKSDHEPGTCPIAKVMAGESRSSNGAAEAIEKNGRQT